MGLPIFFDLFIKGRDHEFDLTMEPLEDLLARERERFGLDHRQVGRAALKYWRFPDQIVACQDLYGEAARNSTTPLLCSLCELSRLFSRMLVESSAGFHEFFTETQRALLLDAESLEEIVVDTFKQVQLMVDSLKVHIDEEKDLMDVMEKANQALMRISQKVATACRPPEEKPLPSYDSLNREQKTVAYTLQAVAHEIRNPLTVVGGFAKRLALSLDPASQAGRYAQVILEETARLEKILASLPNHVQAQAQDSNSER